MNKGLWCAFSILWQEDCYQSQDFVRLWPNCKQWYLCRLCTPAGVQLYPCNWLDYGTETGMSGFSSVLLCKVCGFMVSAVEVISFSFSCGWRCMLPPLPATWICWVGCLRRGHILGNQWDFVPTDCGANQQHTKTPESVSSKQLQRAAKPSALNSLSPKAFWAWLLGTLEAVNLWKLQFSMVTRTVRSLQLTSWAHLYFLEICAFPSHPNTCCSWGKTKQPAIDPSTLLLPAEPC